MRSFKYEDDWTVHRMFIKGRNYPGLCMSRSALGDGAAGLRIAARPALNKTSRTSGVLVILRDALRTVQDIPGRSEE